MTCSLYAGIPGPLCFCIHGLFPRTLFKHKDMLDEQSVTLVFDQLCLALADMDFALDCAQVTVTKLFFFSFREFNSSSVSEWWNTNVGLPSKLL